MPVRLFKALPLAGAALLFTLLCACGGGGSSSSVPLTNVRPLSAATPDSSGSAVGGSVVSVSRSSTASTSATTGSPNYLGYISWFWGNQNQWTINCDAPTYFSPHTCLVVNVQSGGTHVDGPALAAGEFVAIYADPATSGASGLNAGGTARRIRRSQGRRFRRDTADPPLQRRRRRPRPPPRRCRPRAARSRGSIRSRSARIARSIRRSRSRNPRARGSSANQR